MSGRVIARRVLADPVHYIEVFEYGGDKPHTTWAQWLRDHDVESTVVAGVDAYHPIVNLNHPDEGPIAINLPADTIKPGGLTAVTIDARHRTAAVEALIPGSPRFNELAKVMSALAAYETGVSDEDLREMIAAEHLRSAGVLAAEAGRLLEQAADELVDAARSSRTELPANLLELFSDTAARLASVQAALEPHGAAYAHR